MNTYQPGTEIAGYRIESMIGRGGMAVVYRAEDSRLGRKVALKLLTPQLADSEQFRQRFIRESRLAASLDHPNIVPIYEAGEADGQLFIAMRYVIGSDLKGVLAEQGGRLPLEWTLPLFRQVGRALDAAHRAGLVHRDVKPGNILVTNEERPTSARGGHAYLTDFGLTKRASELSGGLTGTGHFLGTVDYVAPEQIQGKPVGHATDIYALGCVLYECLTGQLPFRRDDDAALLWAHLVEPPPPVAGVRPEVPEAVDGVIARAMAKDPADRYGSCEELLRELESAIVPPAAAPPAVTPPAVAPPVPAPAPVQVSPARPGDGAGAATVVSTPSHAGVAVGYSLAIDLGTSFVAAAVADDRGREMFGLGDGALVAPAAVFVRDDGRMVTGEAAARRAVSHPDRVAREVKRHLGNPTPMMLGGSPYAVSDLLGAQLQDVLARVAEQQGAKPEVVALTHPANWGPFRRQQFEDVARAAGISEPLYTTEPEAAAAHYASTRPLAEGEVLAVYDLGGGTFDATVLRREAQGFQILGTPEGIERLGGADFDDAVFAHVNYLAGGALDELDLSDSRTGVAVARLRQDCTLAKEALSVETEATIPVFLPNRHFDITLTRAELEGMIRAPIESTIGTLDRVLRAAQVDRSTLAAVLLVGGSSRIPLIAQMVSEAFGRPTAVSAHPKHAVALGAALLAEARRTKSPVALLSGTGDGETAVGSSIVVVRPGEAVPRETSPADVARPEPAGTPVAAAAAATAAAGAPAPLPTGSSARHAAPVAPGAEPTSPVPHPRAGDSSGGAPPPGSVDGPPSAALPPAPSQPAEVAPPADSSPWWSRYLALIVGLVLLATTAGVVVYLSTRPGEEAAADRAQASSPTSSDPSADPSPSPPTVPPPATAVPVPSVGATIPAGETSGFVVAAPNGRQLYVANREAGVVTVVDRAVNKVTATIEITVGPPQFIAFSPDGRRAYVSVWDEARTIAAVSVLDTTSNAVVATIPVETRPFLAAVSPDGKWLYVPNHDNDSVSVIDTGSNELVTSFTVAPNPHWVAFTPDGTRVYTANHDSNVVSAIDPATNEVLATIPTPTSPHSIDVHPTEPLAIVACFDADAAAVIDTETNKVITTVEVGPDPQYAEWSADGRFAYIVNNDDDTVSVVDAKTFAVTATIPTGSSPTSLGVVPDGSRGYVSNLRDGTLTELNLTG